MSVGVSDRVLVVEDDTSWQQVLAEILTDLDLTVDILGDLESALDAIRERSHRIAVVDLSLDNANHRNSDGLKVLDAIKRHDPGCASLLLTGHATVEIAVSALTEHGAFTCLRKEAFVRSEFREVIRQALAHSVPWANAGPNGKALHTAPEVELTLAAEPASKVALVIEDDAGWRSLLSELLAEADYQIRICSGFGDALGRLGRERYDLAIVDLSLTQQTGWRSPVAHSEQELDGYRLLTSTQASGIPTIVVSGVASPDAIEHMYEQYGIFTYLEKQNFDRRTFLQVIEDIQDSYDVVGELDELTAREVQVLSLLAKGMTNQEIAKALVISSNTVKRHLKSIYKKLDITNRAAATARAIKAGLLAR